MDKSLEVAKTKGYVETLFGRKRYLPEINSKNYIIRSQAERMALNMPIQGTAADIIKSAMIEIEKKLKGKFSETKMLLQVHDEILLSSPKKEAKEAAFRVSSQMEEIVSLDVPIKANYAIGDNWAECSFH